MFNDKSAISAHYVTAHAQSSSGRAEAKHGCDMCYKKYTSKYNLRKHLSYTHGVGDAKTFPCQSCERVYKDKRDLAKHAQKLHSDA